MANTGKKIVLTLKEVYDHNSSPTGTTKPNTPGDPDYIAPLTDGTACPITYTTTCPSVAIATYNSTDDTVEFEFAVLNSVLSNPAVAKVQARLKSGSTTVQGITYTLPHSNYFAGFFTAISTPGTYGIDVAYLNSSNTEVSVCTGLATIVVS